MSLHKFSLSGIRKLEQQTTEPAKKCLPYKVSKKAKRY